MRSLKVLIALLVCFFAGLACNSNAPETTPDSVEVKTSDTATDTAASEAANDDAESADPQGDIARPLLWRAEGEGGPVWLFGTIHGGVDATSFEALPGELQHAIEESELVVLEVDLNDLQLTAIAARAMLRDGTTLDALLGEERWQKLGELVPVPVAQLRGFQPWLVYSLILQGMIGDIEAVDSSIVNHAAARDKEFAFLESATEQIDYLATSITLDVLKEMIDDPEASRDQLDNLIAAYKAGDVDLIESILFDEEEMEKHPQMFDSLLIERNHNWMPHIEQYLQRGNVLVAVGAAHLLGDQGLIDLLEKKGVEVSRVQPN